MSEYNLLDEPWISVVTDYKGTTKSVGLKEFFRDAHKFIALAGDMPTQDFAVMRFLLAILHTVFSRYDAAGKAYEMLKINDRMQQVEKVAEEDQEDYQDALMNTWQALWNDGKFPDIVNEYLEAWKDRFYLFDDKYPFYQVTEAEIDPSNISSKEAGKISAKTVNRLISESGNKVALFSPKYGLNKEHLTYAEITRWLVTLQSYIGLSDKTAFGSEKYKASKGWLFDLGGIYLSADNLYKTLLLNLRIFNKSNEHFNFNIQNPCWENLPVKIVEKRLTSGDVDNIAELYTNWSRAALIDKSCVDNEFKMQIVKLPDITHEDNFLEPMTLWRYNSAGVNKGKFTPKKHQLNKSMWRSFGLITKFEDGGQDKSKESYRKPGIIEWLNDIDRFIENEHIIINAVSMEDDGNATSWVPTNEIVDTLDVGEFLVTDLEKNGWVVRINNVVAQTKEVIEKRYKSFISDIAMIRGLKEKQLDDFKSSGIELMYFKIDKPFRDWLTEIDYKDNKDEKELIWKNKLKKLIIKQAETIMEQACSKDFIGIIEDSTAKNIVTAYNKLMLYINKEL